MASDSGDGSETSPDDPDVEAAELAAAEEALNGELVDDLPRVGDARMVEAIQMLTRHQGPLPSREWLATVEQLAPGTSQQLVADYIAERQHQRTIQTTAVEIDRQNFRAFARYQNRQLFAAWSLVTLIAAGGIVLIATGHSIAGLAALVAELAILAGVFVGRQVIESRSAGQPAPPTE